MKEIPLLLSAEPGTIRNKGLLGWAIDSGASGFVCDPKKEAIVSGSVETGGGVSLDAIGGTIDVSQAGMMSVEPLEEEWPALLVEGSPLAASLGRMVEERGYKQKWDDEGFVLWNPRGKAVPTILKNYVPLLLPRSLSTYAALAKALAAKAPDILDLCLAEALHGLPKVKLKQM